MAHLVIWHKLHITALFDTDTLLDFTCSVRTIGASWGIAYGLQLAAARNDPYGYGD